MSDSHATAPRRDLILVMPVYNEAECIAGVVEKWRDTFARLRINAELLVLNDGSKDETAQVLEQFAADPNVTVVNKPNSGHGPTITQGYREAVGRADWVFQVDSDDEMQPDAFEEFWRRRDRYDAIFGVRWNREQDASRRVLSGGSRLLIRLFFGRGVRDVNVPYRLMRSDKLAPILRAIPDDTFAPNLLISGVFGRNARRVTNRNVLHENRKTGTVSLHSSKLWKIALKSGRQTTAFLVRQRLRGDK